MFLNRLRTFLGSVRQTSCGVGPLLALRGHEAFPCLAIARWYNHGVRRFAFAIIVALLTLSASGLVTLTAGEPCTGYELTRQGEDDGGCPPTCVTCGCCAQAAEPIAVAISSSPDIPASNLTTALPSIPRTDPLDILHVPKLALA